MRTPSPFSRDDILLVYLCPYISLSNGYPTVENYWVHNQC